MGHVEKKSVNEYSLHFNIANFDLDQHLIHLNQCCPPSDLLEVVNYSLGFCGPLFGKH